MIKTESLSKEYSSGTKALNNLSISVEAGEIFGFLGPNGAGKSTTIKILTTLAHPSAGTAWVNGYNVITEPNKVRGSIGYVAQEAGVDYFLSGRENLVLQGRMYRMDKKAINSRVEELLELFELKDSADALVSTYSGGMRRKLDIATALIHNPSIIFLDEPTLGLDPHSRSSLWNYIRILNKDLKVTIFLTTHYLDEADKLSNRIGILHKGSMKIVDTPEALKDSIKGDSVNFSLKGKVKQKAIALLKKNSVVKDILLEDENVRVYVNNGSEAIPGLIKFLGQNDIDIESLSISRPTLDDVYLKYSGASFKEGDGEEEANPWWAQWAKKGYGKNWKAGEWNKEGGAEGQAEEEGGDWQSGKWTEEEMKAWWSQEGQGAGSGEQTATDSEQSAVSSKQIEEEKQEKTEEAEETIMSDAITNVDKNKTPSPGAPLLPPPAKEGGGIWKEFNCSSPASGEGAKFPSPLTGEGQGGGELRGFSEETPVASGDNGNKNGQSEGSGWQSGKWTEEEMKAWWSNGGQSAGSNEQAATATDSEQSAVSSKQIEEEKQEKTEETPVASGDNLNKEEPWKKWTEEEMKAWWSKGGSKG